MIRGNARASCIGGVAAALLCTLLLGACGSGGASSNRDHAAAKPGGTLQLGVQLDPETLAPTSYLLGSALDVGSQINESLFWQNEQGKLEPLLATGFKVSSNGLNYTVPIRRGVKFSTGKPMTAKDVVFSIEQARKSTYFSGLYEPITKVVATSPSTVVITTKEPVAGMEADLASPVSAIVPDNYGGASEKQFAQHPIGTGPFLFKSWTQGQSITLVQNPQYWQAGKPLLNEVVFHVVSDDNSRVSQLRGGDLDAIEGPPFPQLKSLEGSSSFRRSLSPLSRADGVVLNLNKPLFANDKVREAVSLALDRQGIVDASLSGEGEVAGSFLPPTAAPFFDPSIKAPAPDAAKAKSLLAEAVKEGVQPSFTLTSLAGETFSTIASQVIQQDLAEVGFTVKLQPLDPATVFAKIEESEVDASMMGYYLSVADPSELVAYVGPSIAGPTGGNEKALKELGGEAASELNSAKRKELYYQLQEMVAGENNLIMTDYQPLIWMLNSSLVGFEQDPLDLISLKDTGFGS